MAHSSLEPIYQHVVSKLEKGLSPDLTYHSLSHTQGVFQRVSSIAQAESVTQPEALFLLQIAALYHDTGFLYTYQDHEERGCELAREELPGFGLSTEEIETVCGLILATKVPQKPQNQLQEIICDADLDYLGREDFFSIGETLFQEFKCYGVVQNETEWNQLQVRFLDSHTFFTSFGKNSRETQKQKHLQRIKDKLNRRP